MYLRALPPLRQSVKLSEYLSEKNNLIALAVRFDVEYVLVESPYTQVLKKRRCIVFDEHWKVREDVTEYIHYECKRKKKAVCEPVETVEEGLFGAVQNADPTISTGHARVSDRNNDSDRSDREKVL